MQENGRLGRIDFETQGRYKVAVRFLGSDCGGNIAVSDRPNSMHGRPTIVRSLVDACTHSKNASKLAASRRECERERRGCVCNHTGKCRRQCRCKRQCGCKYWRDPDAPSHETVRKSVSGATVEESMNALERNISRCWNMMVRTGRIRPWEEDTLGFDKTAKLRSAKSKGLVHGKFNGKVGWHEVYMTAQVLSSGRRFTVAAVAMDDSMSNAEAIRALLAAAKGRVPNIRRVLGDKEFCTTEGINEIKAAGLEYIVAHPHSKRTDKAIAELEESGGTSAAMESTMHGKGGAARYWLRVEPSRKARDGKWKPEDGLREKYVLYAASDGETDVTLYSDRWGIETGYRQIEEVRARTASRSHGVRVFFFIFAVMLCNIWVLVNEVRPAVGAHRRATLQTVAMILHRTAGELVSELHPPPPRAPPDPASA